MTFMNPKTNKKKIYFNLIDVLLIVLALAAAASLVFFLRERRVVTGSDSASAEIVYRVEFSPLREELRNLAEVGNTVMNADTLEVIGEITDVSYAPCVYVGTDKTTGASVSTAYPDRITMILTVKATASVTDAAYEVGGQELILGETLSIRVPDFTGSGIIVSVAKAPSVPSDRVGS